MLLTSKHLKNHLRLVTPYRNARRVIKQDSSTYRTAPAVRRTPSSVTTWIKQAQIEDSPLILVTAGGIAVISYLYVGASLASALHLEHVMLAIEHLSIVAGGHDDLTLALQSELLPSDTLEAIQEHHIRMEHLLTATQNLIASGIDESSPEYELLNDSIAAHTEESARLKELIAEKRVPSAKLESVTPQVKGWWDSWGRKTVIIVGGCAVVCVILWYSGYFSGGGGGGATPQIWDPAAFGAGDKVKKTQQEPEEAKQEPEEAKQEPEEAKHNPEEKARTRRENRASAKRLAEQRVASAREDMARNDLYLQAEAAKRLKTGMPASAVGQSIADDLQAMLATRLGKATAELDAVNKINKHYEGADAVGTAVDITAFNAHGTKFRASAAVKAVRFVKMALLQTAKAQQARAQDLSQAQHARTQAEAEYQQADQTYIQSMVDLNQDPENAQLLSAYELAQERCAQAYDRERTLTYGLARAQQAYANAEGWAQQAQQSYVADLAKAERDSAWAKAVDQQAQQALIQAQAEAQAYRRAQANSKNAAASTSDKPENRP